MSKPLLQHESGDQQALIAHLSSTIGQEVEDAMNTVGWEHTVNTPVAQAHPETPAPVTSPPESPQANPSEQATVTKSDPASATTALDFEQFRDDNGLILGKYKTYEQAVKGMHSVLHMAKAALSERDQLRAQMDQLSRPQPVVTEPTVKPERTNRSERLEQLLAKAKSDEGLTADDLPSLVEALDENAEMKARRLLEQERATQTRDQREWDSVDSYMAQNHPDSLKFVDELKVFLSSNSDVGRRYNRLLEAHGADSAQAKLDATVYAWEAFERANPHVTNPVDPAALAQEQQVQANAQVRREEVEAARKDAGLLGNSASGVHEGTQNMGPTQEEIDAAAQYMKQTGDGTAWRRMTIGKDLNHPIFDNF